MLEEFKKFTDNYDITNPGVLLKINHSIRTSVLCKKLSTALKMNEDDIKLATCIGLIHDIGRFEQIKLFNNFNDANIDHAHLGTKMLFEDKLIKRFYDKESDYELIKKAVYWHNAYEIGEELDERTLAFCKLIRDCDKVEILYRYGICDIKMKEGNDQISSVVKKTFFDARSVKKSDAKNGNDRIVLILCFIFDINYKESIDLLLESSSLEKMYSLIEDKEKFKEYFDYIDKYIKEKYYVRKKI